MNMHDYVWLCMPIHDYVWLFMSRSDYVRQFKLVHLIQMFSHFSLHLTNLDFVVYLCLQVYTCACSNDNWYIFQTSPLTMTILQLKLVKGPVQTKICRIGGKLQGRCRWLQNFMVSSKFKCKKCCLWDIGEIKATFD